LEVQLAARWLGAVVLLLVFGACASGDGANPHASTPLQYRVKIEATAEDSAPFSVTGSEATVDVAAEQVRLELTLTSEDGLVIDDIRWGYVDDEPDPGIAVAGQGCTPEVERGVVGCDDMFRILEIRPGRPLREPVTVFLVGDDAAGTYGYVQPVAWWRVAPEDEPAEVVDNGPPDGLVEVQVRVDVRTTEHVAS